MGPRRTGDARTARGETGSGGRPARERCWNPERAAVVVRRKKGGGRREDDGDGSAPTNRAAMLAASEPCASSLRLSRLRPGSPSSSLRKPSFHSQTAFQSMPGLFQRPPRPGCPFGLLCAHMSHCFTFITPESGLETFAAAQQLHMHTSEAAQPCSPPLFILYNTLHHITTCTTAQHRSSAPYHWHRFAVHLVQELHIPPFAHV